MGSSSNLVHTGPSHWLYVWVGKHALLQQPKAKALVFKGSVAGDSGLDAGTKTVATSEPGCAQ